MAIAERKEGRGLLGEPTFIDVGNGKLRCVETGHELPAEEAGSYGRSKRCRSGLIDAAVLQSKPPLNVFKLDPLSRSKLICKLTGDTINKTEEHIWKHINGKRFLNKLELTESGAGNERRKDKLRAMVIRPCSENIIKEEKEKGIAELISEIREAPEDKSDTDDDDGFWVPPGGTGSGASSDSEEDTTHGNTFQTMLLLTTNMSQQRARVF
uniref:Surfeit locus protein 2 n=1 Tax=Kalanchoe fedtschenkoi TaxID=63787 RepID=A0A7N0TP37_KALFE